MREPHRHIPMTTTLDTLDRITPEQIECIDRFVRAYRTTESMRVFRDPFHMQAQDEDPKLACNIEFVLSDKNEDYVMGGMVEPDGRAHT